MINWMQKHKKSLIPTIWVSTIAFVGAGFVGWGAYDMNANRAGSIAKVGQISVTNQELNTKYSELYNRLYSMSDGKFTREQAENMHLDEIAAEELIKEAYFLNFATDLGLKATEKDIAEFVVNAPIFQENGKFSQILYDNTVKNSGLSKKEFERNLARAITLEKLSEAIKVVPGTDIVEAITASALVEDSVSAQVIYADNNVSFSDADLKKFWKGEKNRYMSDRVYTLDTYFMPIDSAEVSDAELEKFYSENRSAYRSADDKVLDFAAAKESVKRDFDVDQAKKSALKKYLQIKKGEADTNETITATAKDFPIDELGEAKVGELLKPFEYNGGNLIVKIKNIDEPKPLGFEEAKELASVDYRAVRAGEVLKESAENALKNFSGTPFGKFSLNSTNSTDLRDDEFYKFLAEMFSKPAKEGIVFFDDKALVYKITEQNLGSDISINENKAVVAQKIDGMINSNLQGDLMKLLQKRYKLERYYKGRESE